jgi:hypothetical protein
MWTISVDSGTWGENITHPAAADGVRWSHVLVG